MGTALEGYSTIIRNDRGLSFKDSRITLLDVMDYFTADWPPHLIQSALNLNDQQIQEAMDYIEEHRAEVEAEYQEDVRLAEENRRYWENRNRERLSKLPTAKMTTEQLKAYLREKALSQKEKIFQK
jgi:hypothetical protein